MAQVVKESTCNEGALDWGDRLEWHGNPLQYSCLENPYGQKSLAGYSPQGHSQTKLSN